MCELTKLLILTVGLPKSGKSTWARLQASQHGWPIVCPDAIRLAFHGTRYNDLAEPFVWATAKVMVRALFLAGHNAVILDATNATRKRRAEWKSNDWLTVHRVLDTPKEECLRRAEGDPEILPVIECMAAAWEPLGEDEAKMIPLGATGQYPQGVYQHGDDLDQGELRAAITTDRAQGRVRIEFGKSLAWLALTREETLDFAEKLRFAAGKLS